MLTDNEKHILSCLEKLRISALPLHEQDSQVTEIGELLHALEEEIEAAQLLQTPASSSPTFVKLARHRLVDAQKQSLDNYEVQRRSRTKRTHANQHNYQPEEDTATVSTGAAVSDDKLAQSIYESKSESITQVLQRMHTMAQGEILKSELNIGELDMSSRTLRELQEKYSGVDVLLNGSRKLVKVLDEAEKWDRWCMLASLGFLAFVMLYIIYRRILSGPIKILLWSLFQLVGLAKMIPISSGSSTLSAHHSQPTFALSSTYIPSEVLPVPRTLTTMEELQTSAEPVEPIEPIEPVSEPEAAEAETAEADLVDPEPVDLVEAEPINTIPAHDEL